MSDETSRPSNDDATTVAPDQSRKMARRYFVKAVVYAAPAVASVVAVNHASAQTSFCATTCPNVGSCTNASCLVCTVCQ